MTFHLKRNLIVFATLLLIMQITKAQDDQPTESEEEEGDSSSEETVEDSNESRKRRRRRSLDTSDESSSFAAKSTENNINPARAIPGLPDPATILKIAEILTTVGEQVIPILISGNSAAPEFISKRILRDMQFLKNFKNEIDAVTESIKKKK